VVRAATVTGGSPTRSGHRASAVAGAGGEDDRRFFPVVTVAPVVYTPTLEEHPELADVFARITPLITDEVMVELNRRVDVDGEEPADVELDWMRSRGLVS
jgi:osmoprotectant transport system substrate-binding protein